MGAHSSKQMGVGINGKKLHTIGFLRIFSQDFIGISVLDDL